MKSDSNKHKTRRIISMLHHGYLEFLADKQNSIIVTQKIFNRNI
uniref:Uncharacterized protein n=1 Tax=Rhizophora mucronata TaxID=61149 RepID=A0A2P2R432_RHIMU